MNFTKAILVFFLFAIIFTTSCSVPEVDTTTADMDFINAVIVVDADASSSQKYAASELALFLKQITGRNFKVTNDPALNKVRILVGPEAAKLANPEMSYSIAELGDDGILVRSVGNNLVIADPEPRGTLYAVYTFLEDQLGCRWWSSTESTIPKRSDLRMPPIDFNPDFPDELVQVNWILLV